jgi:hypothetical protein
MKQERTNRQLGIAKLCVLVTVLVSALALSGTAQAITRTSGNGDGPVSFVAPGDPTNMGLGYYVCPPAGPSGVLAMSTTSRLRVWPAPAYARSQQRIIALPYFEWKYNVNDVWHGYGYGTGRAGDVPAGGVMSFNFSGANAFHLPSGYMWRVWYDIRWQVNGQQVAQAWYVTSDDMYWFGGSNGNGYWLGGCYV